jgi:hypothetical protein
MSRPTRWAVVAFLFLPPLAGLTYAYPTWPTDAGLDVWSVPSLQAELERREHQREELDEQLQVITHRIACKNEIASHLITGRLSLREAAVAFRSANANSPHFTAIMRFKYPSATDDELHARNAIETAAWLLDDTTQRSELRARLDDDLEALRRDGEVCLN